MAMKCFSKLNPALISAGLAVLIMSMFTATVVFGSYCDNHSPMEFKTPYHETEYYDCAIAVSVLSALGFLIGLICFVLALFLSSKLIIFILGASCATFGFMVMIAEGCFFGSVKRYKYYEEAPKLPGFGLNRSVVQNYIKDTLKATYNQAIANFKEISITGMLSFEDFEKKLGLEHPTLGGHYSYDDIFVGEQLVTGRDYVTIGVSNGLIYAYYNKTKVVIGTDLIAIPARKYKKYQWACWFENTEKTKYKCDLFTSKEVEEAAQEVSASMILPSVKAIIIPKWDPAIASYTVAGIPPGFSLLSYKQVEETMKKENYTFAYSKLNHTFSKFPEALEEINYQFKLNHQKPKFREGELVQCEKKPESYEEFNGEERKMQCLGTSIFTLEEQIMKNSNWKHTNVDGYPSSYVSNVFKYGKESAILRIENLDFIASIGIGLLIIQMVGIFVWTTGAVFDLLFGSSDEGKA